VNGACAVVIHPLLVCLCMCQNTSTAEKRGHCAELALLGVFVFYILEYVGKYVFLAIPILIPLCF
jgi:hypothetical protein